MKILLAFFLSIIYLPIHGQITEWKTTNTFRDYQHTGVESSDKRYIAKIIGRAITVFDTQNNNKEIIAGLTDGQYGAFSDDSRVYFSFKNEQFSVRFLEKELNTEGIKYIKTPTKILSIIVRKNLVFCSFENGKVIVYDWQKREQINNFQLAKNPITFIQKNPLSNAVIFREVNNGLFHWDLGTYKVSQISNTGSTGWFSDDGLFIFYESKRNFYQFDLQKQSTNLIISIPKETSINEDSSTFGFAINSQNTLLATFDYSVSDPSKNKSSYHIWDFKTGKLVKTISLNYKIFSIDFKKSSNEIIAQLKDIKTSEQDSQTYLHLNNFKSGIYEGNSPKKKDEKKSIEFQSLNATRKVALVIGNSKYKFNDLKGIPVNDATDVAKKLNDLGFAVSFLHDATKNEIDNTLLTLNKNISKSDIILFFYAGHGIEVDGKNYLIPIDATLEKKSDVAKETVALDNILTSMKTLNSPVNLIYLDACRNNPFRSWSRGDQSLGFSEVEINMPTMKLIML